MKKILSVLLFTLLCVNVVSAQETQKSEEIQQNIQNKDVYFGVNYQKTPDIKNGQQMIYNHRTFFTINIIHNGKIQQLSTAKK